MARPSDPDRQATDPSEGMETPRVRVGDLLRSARLSRDEDLKDVAGKLRIRLPYLEAIEEGRLNELPGPTYAVGFVRAYADHLGLETEDIVARFKADSRALEGQAELVFPEPLPGSKVPGFAMLLVAIVLGGLVYGGWLYVSSQDRSVAELVPAVPDRLAALIDDLSGVGEEAGAPTPLDADEAPAEPPAAESTPEPADDLADDLAEAPAAAPEPEATPADEAESVPDSEPAPAQEAAPAEGEAETDAETEETPPAANEASTTPQPPIRTAEEIAAEAERAANAAEPPASEPAAPQTPEPAPEAESEAAPTPDAQEESVERAATDPTPEPETETEAVAEAPAASEPVDEPGDQPGDEPAPTPSDADPTAAEIESESLPEPGAESEPSAAETGAEPVAESEPAQTATVPEPPAAPAPEAAPTADTAETSAFGAPAGESRIALTARVASWIEVTGPDGETLIARLLRAGETYRAPDRAGVTLVTGNAGGLLIVVDGEPVPDIGPLGTVRRNVPLDPAKLKAGVATEG